VSGAGVNIQELSEDYIFMSLENYEQTKLPLEIGIIIYVPLNSSKKGISSEWIGEK